jgi:hypothetical protein
MRRLILGAATLSLVACGRGNSTAHTPPPIDKPPSDTTNPAPGNNTNQTPPPQQGGEDPTTEPPFAVTVGGPPSSCVVYEYPLPMDPRDGQHKPQDSVIEYQHNPPTSGPNYEMWAAYQKFDTLARPHWVHNLRHGAIVLVYRPDAPQEVIDVLNKAYDLIPQPPIAKGAKPDCRKLGIMAPDPELPNTYAVLAWNWMMTSNCMPKVEDIAAFANKHIYDAPEKECYDGAWPIRPPCFRFEDAPAAEYTHIVPEGTPVTYVHQPVPTSGPYYANTLKYGRYDVVVPEPYWTGILAKGGVVILYRPDAPAAMIQDLKNQFDTLPTWWKCNRPMAAMVQSTALDHPWAFVANDQYMTGETLACWSVAGFVTSRRGWGPFPSCDDGTYVPPVP